MIVRNFPIRREDGRTVARPQGRFDLPSHPWFLHGISPCLVSGRLRPAGVSKQFGYKIQTLARKESFLHGEWHS